MPMITRLLGLVALICTAVAVWLYLDLRTTQQALTGIEAEMSTLQMRVDADELFLNGKIPDAMVLYRMIDSLTRDSIQRQRQQLSNQYEISTDSEKLEMLSRKLESTTALLRAYQAQKTDQKDFIVIEQTGEILELQEEISALKEKLAAAQKEIDQVKTRRGIIRFETSKNSAVTYFGDLENGKANGTGFGYWKSGSTYEGNWKDNQRHGKGSFTWADGERYEGDYLNDKRHGYGIYFAKAGKYEGQWENDMRHGEGYLYEPNGKLKVHGVWEKDKLVKTIK